MNRAVKIAIKGAGKLIAISLPIAGAAAVAGPLAATLAGCLVVVVVALCWVLDDPERTRRLVDLITATRGAPSGPTPDRRSIE